MLKAIGTVDSFKGNSQTPKTAPILNSGVTKDLAVDTASFASKKVRPSRLKSMFAAATLGLGSMFGGTTLAGCAESPVGPNNPVVTNPTTPTRTLSAAEQKFIATMAPLNPIVEYVHDGTSTSTAARALSSDNVSTSLFKGFSKIETQIAENNKVASVDSSQGIVTLNSASVDVQTGVIGTPDKVNLSATDSSSSVKYQSGLSYELINLGDGTVKRRSAAGSVAILKPGDSAGTVIAYDSLGKSPLRNGKITKFTILVSDALPDSVKVALRALKK